MAESSSSCEIYGLLKRGDEKYVTEKAYDNPKFVEDTVRDISLKLNKLSSITTYFISSENFESIIITLHTLKFLKIKYICLLIFIFS